MEKKLLALSMLLVIRVSAFAQQEYKTIRFFYRPSIGTIFCTRSYSPVQITDNLVGAKFRNLFLQPLDIGFFFKNVGIEGHFLLLPAQNRQKKQNQFVKDVNNKYGDSYYTTISSSITYDHSADNSDPLTRGSIGPCYKVEKNHFVVIGRVMIGAASINTNWARARLKGKNTNELIYIDWNTHYANQNCFSVNPSFTFAYRVNRRISFDIDLDSWFYKPDITYKEITKNAASGSTTINDFRYKHFMNDISIGVGTMVVFK